MILIDSHRHAKIEVFGEIQGTAPGAATEMALVEAFFGEEEGGRVDFLGGVVEEFLEGQGLEFFGEAAMFELEVLPLVGMAVLDDRDEVGLGDVLGDFLVDGLPLV
jgi:hypothetical protein